MGSADSRLYGYWYDIDSMESSDFSEALGIFVMHPKGLSAQLPNETSAKGRYIHLTEVEVEGNTLTFRSTRDAHVAVSEITFVNDDLIKYQSEGQTFYSKRMPEDEYLMKALLRIALTGEIASYSSVSARDFFGKREIVTVNLKDDRNQIMLVDFPKQNLSGTVTRNGSPLGIAMNPGVLALHQRKGENPAQFEQVVTEASKPIM